jgi:aminocarboxymuconate-semialdehyde decarboxylase
MIVDIHNHFLPVETVRSLPVDVRFEERDGVTHFIDTRGHDFALSGELIDLDAQRAAMVRQRVDCRALVPPPFYLQYELPAEQGVLWARGINDGIAEAARSGARAFVGFGTVPLQDVNASIAELARATSELGLRGIEIATNINGVELDDPSLEPFWAALEQTGVPLLIHPHYVAGAKRMQAYHLRNLIGNPLETALAGARLIFGGVLKRHPDLVVILSHGGGALPGIAGRLEQGRRARTECPGELPFAEELKSLYYDTIVFDQGALRQLVDAVGADRIVLGTDAPFDMSEADPVAFVKTAGLSDAQVATILANANNLIPG